MKRFLMIAALMAFTSFAQAGPICNAVAGIRENIAERRASRVAACTPQPVREFVQAQPVRTVAANVLDATSGVIQTAGSVIRPTCSNGQCPR